MNTDWSSYVQGVQTLYLTRKLRFHDHFFNQYKKLFSLDAGTSFKLLEIGCGPGALAESLHRWYPNASITGLDRDSTFISFAASKAPDLTFLEGDATRLPFESASFDVTISNTVSEHIEPSAFFGEQHRVLKKGGICLVISARRGINIQAPCLEDGVYEKAFWEKVQLHDTTMTDFHVCQYPMTEAQLPWTMEKHGFVNVTSGYAILPLTPDDPSYSSDMAFDMIEAGRANALEAIERAYRTLSNHISREEAETMLRLTNEKYNLRRMQYLNKEKQWNTNVSVLQVVRGEKA